jgi:hypothetical protein
LIDMPMPRVYYGIRAIQWRPVAPVGAPQDAPASVVAGDVSKEGVVKWHTM